jgi:hypothetical protein
MERQRKTEGCTKEEIERERERKEERQRDRESRVLKWMGRVKTAGC